jgi:AraC-like DNA-binding protein
VNPPGPQLGRRNAIYIGTGSQHDSGEVDGWLSIKMMLAGSAVWKTTEREFTVDESSYLILNDRHRYRLSFDSATPVTTFVLFFERGLVEDALRCRTTPSATLLDEPARPAAPAEFIERLETRASPLFGLLARVRRTLSQNSGLPDSDDWFLRLAAQMVREERSAARAIARLPAVRAATRQELFRRVLRGRDFLLSQAAEGVTLPDAARAACLSPFHFHRAFSQAFGITPHQVLTRHRLERAAAMLAAGLPVTEVCLSVGFESLGSFSTLFRRHFGVSPRDFRNRRHAAQTRLRLCFALAERARCGNRGMPSGGGKASAMRCRGAEKTPRTHRAGSLRHHTLK